METRLEVLYPLILVNCRPTWLPSCVSLKQLIYHHSSSLVALNSALVSSQLTTPLKGGGVTIFNILTISSVGIGIGGNMFKINFFDFKNSQKIKFILF